MKKSTRRSYRALKGRCLRPELYRNAFWQMAQIRAGRTQQEAASVAGCAVPTLARWRALLNISGKNGSPSTAPKHARRTYANRQWLAKRVAFGMPMEAIAACAHTTPVVVRIWMRRFGITAPCRYAVSLAQETFLKRRWLSARVERSDAEIRDEVNRYAQQEGWYWRYSRYDIARARARFKLSSVRQARYLRLHRGFTRWFARHTITLQRLRPRQQQILRACFGSGIFQNGAKIAARLHCTRANVHAQRLRALIRFHAIRAIPRRFWRLFCSRQGKGHRQWYRALEQRN